MKYFVVIITALLLVAGIGFYYFNKPNASLKEKKADYTMSADELFSSFEKNEAAANQKYLDKVIAVSGEIQAISNEVASEKSITLKTASGMFGVICKMDSTVKDEIRFSQGQTVKIKGVCTGMLMDVVLIRCVPLQ